MIVFAGGMQRSGSTFSFNVARDLLRRRGSLHHEASPDILAVLRGASTADHVLLKAHELDETGITLARLGAIRVVCTVRRPADAVASWMISFGFSEAESIAYMRHWLAMYRQIRDVALTVPYELVDRHPVRAAHMIARFLFHSSGWREAWQIGNRYAKARSKVLADSLPDRGGKLINLGYSQYDPETFFHLGHVSSLRSLPAEQRLPPEQALRIHTALQEAACAAGLYRGTGRDPSQASN